MWGQSLPPTGDDLTVTPSAGVLPGHTPQPAHETARAGAVRLSVSTRGRRVEHRTGPVEGKRQERNFLRIRGRKPAIDSFASSFVRPPFASTAGDRLKPSQYHADRKKSEVNRE